MIHSSADVQSKNIGEDTNIWQFVVILPGAVIGRNCNINAHCFIENDVLIGDNVTCEVRRTLWDGIVLEDFVQVGPNVTFTNDLYPRAKQKFTLSKTTVKSGASIGANATIIGGITIGEFALIGAGSVVTKSVSNNSLWVGNPARLVGYVCNCGRKLDKSLHCPGCDSTYILYNERIVRQ